MSCQMIRLGTNRSITTTCHSVTLLYRFYKENKFDWYVSFFIGELCLNIVQLVNHSFRAGINKMQQHNSVYTDNGSIILELLHKITNNVYSQKDYSTCVKRIDSTYLIIKLLIDRCI